MKTKTRISLSEPDASRPDQYFSIRLKGDLFNEPSTFMYGEKLLVISDIEGNFQQLRQLLEKNKVINSRYTWTFDNGHLIILGDCFDRGELVAECLWLIYCLEEKARKAGGYVHFILGNHEIMNMNGDWRYVHPKYAIRPNTSRHPTTALYDANNELWRWLRTKNIMEKVGDTLFVHGGISSEILQLNLSIQEINNLSRPYYTEAAETFSDPRLYTLFNSESSPFWYRGYYQESATEELVDATLKHFGVKTIVTGHTVVEHVSSYYNGKIINIDTDHAAGNSEALLIKGHRFYKVDSTGKRERIK